MKAASASPGKFLLTLTISFSLITHGIRALASDHGDEHRGAANIGDFYVFKRDKKLVLIMTLLADLPVNLNRFHLPHDVTYRFLIDRNADVRFDNAEDVKKYGGTVHHPEHIEEDVTIELRFDHLGGQQVSATGLLAGTVNDMTIFAGVRDEPFIRGGFDRRNIACIAIDLPLACIIAADSNPIILAWCTTDTTSRHEQTDLQGHPYRSQGLVRLNSLHPSAHTKTLNVPPDVNIYNTALPAKFPNGRELADDVVDAFLSPQDIIARHGSNPSQNDVPFQAVFPYLAPAHTFTPGNFPGPPENLGAFNTSVTGFSLEQAAGIPGRNVRLRYWSVLPGGVFGQHFHDARPSMVYLLEGALIETKKEKDGPVSTKTISANEIFEEPAGTTHWLVNATQGMVRMIVVDIVKDSILNRVKSGWARKTAMPTPIKVSERAVETLAQYDLEREFPNVEAAKSYTMKATRITLQPGERSALSGGRERPRVAYVIRGDVLEYRSDEESAVRRAGEASVRKGNTKAYWENVSSETVQIFQVEIIRKGQN